MSKPDIEMTSTQRDDGNYNVEIILTGSRSEVDAMLEELTTQLQEKDIQLPVEITYHKIQ